MSKRGNRWFAIPNLDLIVDSKPGEKLELNESAERCLAKSQSSTLLAILELVMIVVEPNDESWSCLPKRWRTGSSGTAFLLEIADTMTVDKAIDADRERR